MNFPYMIEEKDAASKPFLAKIRQTLKRFFTAVGETVDPKMVGTVKRFLTDGADEGVGVVRFPVPLKLGRGFETLIAVVTGVSLVLWEHHLSLIASKKKSTGRQLPGD